MRVLQRGGLTMVLVALCGTLSATIWAELQAPSALDARSAALERLPSPITLPDSEITYRPLQDYDEIIHRPLFNETRAPIEITPVDEVSEAPEASQEVQQLSLTGVVISTEKVIALIRDARAGTVHRIERGHSLGEWTLADVDKDRVTLRRDETERHLMLYEKNRNDKVAPRTNSRSAARARYKKPDYTTNPQSGRRTLLRPR